uniref:Putative minor tail protein n=1 Tax=viral metagenome TaxID=1070528 RepID=A0A6M3J2P2_9ZZZZ
MKVEISQSDLNKAKFMLAGIKGAYPRVLTRSINKALTGARTDAVGEIAKDLNLTKTRIRKDFSTINANYSTLSGKLVSTGKPVGLIEFKARQTKKGTGFQVKKTGKRTVISSAFIQTSNTAKNVFIRKRISGKKRVARLPIERLSGPRIQDIYAKPEIYDATRGSGLARMAKEFDRLLDMELKKL